MSYTDPSGYFFKAIGKFVKKYWRAIVQIGITVMTAGAGLGWAIAGGALSGYVATGSLKGALVGAFSGALFFGAGELIANNGITNIFGKGLIRGVAGGISSVLSGGKFGHGFAAAGITSMAGGKIDANFKSFEGRMLAAAVVGGTASAITGGKFANGAITAAFMKGYNDANHPSGEHPDNRLAKWLKGLYDGAAEIRSSIEGGLNEVGTFISDVGSGLASGSASVFKGDVRALRYLGRSTGLLGSNEFTEANREGHIMDRVISEGASAAYENPELISEAISLAVDHAADHANTRNVSHMIGRTVTGVVLAPLGALAAVGDVTYGIEQGNTSLQEALKDAAYGH